jgi:hypothetical protein
VSGDKLLLADSAASYATKNILLSDLQTMLKTAGFPYVLEQGGVPSGIAPTGTVGDATTANKLVLGTALNTTYSDGIYLYFPANAIASGSSAGSYWCVMSSTTDGLVYTDALGSGWPTTPSSPTPAAGYGTATSYTGATTTITLATATLPANALGPYGFIDAMGFFSCNNNANAKTVIYVFGGTTIFSISVASSKIGNTFRRVMNRGVTNDQVSSYSSAAAIGFGTTTAAPIFAAVDTTSAVTLQLQADIDVATDFVVLEQAAFTVGYGA